MFVGRGRKELGQNPARKKLFFFFPPANFLIFAAKLIILIYKINIKLFLYYLNLIEIRENYMFFELNLWVFREGKMREICK